MEINKLYSQLATIFSKNFIKDILENGHKSKGFQLFSNISRKFSGLSTVGDVYQSVYSLLRKKYRCEYIYKNAIIDKILLGKHSINSSVAFDELVVGSCKADLVIINDTSTVYEIKTELDSLERLERQIKSYSEIFEYIYIVTCEKYIQKVLEIIPHYIGIMILTDRYTLRTVKKAQSNIANIKSSKVFDMLRKSEYLDVIKSIYKDVPDVPNTMIYKKCREQFEKLPSELAHKMMVKKLKKRELKEYQKNFLNEIPLPMKLIGIKEEMTQQECERLKSLLGKKLD